MPSAGLDRSSNIKISDFFKNGEKCGDPLDLCEDIEEESKYKSTLSFDTTASQDEILPINYFCIYKVNDLSENPSFASNFWIRL